MEAFAEGLDLPGSDMDIMRILNNVQVIQNGQHMHRTARYTNLLLVYDMEFPGFSRLKYIPNSDHEDGHIYTAGECFVETTNGMYMSNNLFIRKFIEVNIGCNKSVHGPCLSDKDGEVDMAICFHLHSWPREQNNGYIVVDLVSGLWIY